MYARPTDPPRAFGWLGPRKTRRGGISRSRIRALRSASIEGLITILPTYCILGVCMSASLARRLPLGFFRPGSRAFVVDITQVSPTCLSLILAAVHLLLLSTGLESLRRHQTAAQG